MNETLKKINVMVKLFNESFEIDKTTSNDEINKLHIKELKNDGSEFVGELFDMFSEIIKASSPEHELIFNEEKGLVIAKKVYVFEE